MIYNLPTSVEIDGIGYEIRSDYRAVLDILTALSDNDLKNAEKINVLLNIFYGDEIPENIGEAVQKCFGFISRNQPESDSRSTAPRLMDWQKDFNFIADAIMLKCGVDVRSVSYMHWWTFVGYYLNIGDCFFAQIISLRKKLKKNQKLDAIDKEFYRDNKQIVDLPERLTAEDAAVLSEWLGGGRNGG